MSTNEAKAPAKKKEFKGEVFIDPDRCKGCAFCVELCPTGVLELSEKFNSKGYHPPVAANLEKCTGCDLCGMFCPDFAIFGIRIRVEKPAGAAKKETPKKELQESACGELS
jgi:2-oxoglutarate ferredoxin oxidoreductase subunit delta